MYKLGCFLPVQGFHCFHLPGLRPERLLMWAQLVQAKQVTEGKVAGPDGLTFIAGPCVLVLVLCCTPGGNQASWLY